MSRRLLPGSLLDSQRFFVLGRFFTGLRLFHGCNPPASLLDEGVYHCSIRTMYLILAANQEVRERRDQLRHPAYQKPELLAARAEAKAVVDSWNEQLAAGRTCCGRQ